ncbi:hypothetical protein EDB80DRAFT_691487 [Ilyonectria destructans]|nr:hypothetical protein EDB80DRAFT_691487 [Ilyonectria destructans]
MEIPLVIWFCLGQLLAHYWHRLWRVKTSTSGDRSASTMTPVTRKLKYPIGNASSRGVRGENLPMDRHLKSLPEAQQGLYEAVIRFELDTVGLFDLRDGSSRSD